MESLNLNQQFYLEYIVRRREFEAGKRRSGPAVHFETFITMWNDRVTAIEEGNVATVAAINKLLYQEDESDRRINTRIDLAVFEPPSNQPSNLGGNEFG